ncbi:hypothetical protein [Vibrio parahaemolyticus]|uniref:hypothetical protein n=1 Tax=Vibrio parahaemolyticus TaxID=670 RepID=UPI001559123E|nr:hypothetical protein [Vibrio parahaemolyticus]
MSFLTKKDRAEINELFKKGILKISLRRGIYVDMENPEYIKMRNAEIARFKVTVRSKNE